MLIKDRVVEFRRVKASDLLENEKNPRLHPESQRKAIRGILAEIGFAGAELCYHSERNGGALTLIDGHMRRNEMADQEVPCLVTDLDDDEADKLLAVLDPISALAQHDDQKMSDLLAGVQSEDEAVNALLDQLAKDHEVDDGPTEIKSLETRSPPKMSWVLIGLPTTRFGEIAMTIETLALIPGIVCETSLNDVGANDGLGDDQGQRQEIRQPPREGEAGPPPVHAGKVSRRKR